MTSLESEVRELIWSALTSEAATMDALLMGDQGAEVTDHQFMREVLFPMQRAQSEALIRVARAIDQLSDDS